MLHGKTENTHHKSKLLVDAWPWNKNDNNFYLCRTFKNGGCKALKQNTQ